MNHESSSVFVYGTLKPGEKNAHVADLGGPFAAREAWLEGFRLYDLRPEGYPAMVRGAGRVHGVVLRFENISRALPHLDRLEGIEDTPPLYERVLVEVSPRRERCWTYLYLRKARLAMRGSRPVEGGIWPELQRGG